MTGKTMRPDRFGRQAISRPSPLDRYGTDESTVRLTVEVAEGVACLRVAGEVDILHAPALLDAARRTLRHGTADLVVDCSGIEFISSAGLNVLLDLHHAAREEGRTVILRHPSAFVRRLLRITGIDRVLMVEGTG